MSALQITRYRPNAVVQFFTETGNLVARATTDPKSDIDNDIVNIQTVRDMGADAPTFSISLTRNKPWHKWVASNDLVTISMVRPPEANRKVFVGLVDDCRKRVSIQDGKPQRVITITGRGMAKAFIEFDIGVVPEANELYSPSVGWLTANGITFAGQNADQIISQFWRQIVEKYVNYKFADGRTLTEITKRNLTARANAKLTHDLGLINWQNSILAFMKEVADAPFNELFWETDGESPVLYVRPTPFNKKEWNDLPSITILDEDVIIDDIGRSDVETYTLFSVGMKAFYSSNSATNSLGVYPYWYKPYADKYGIRRLHVDTLYSAWGSAEDAGQGDAVKSYQADLFNWNINNNSFYNGTIMVKGSNQYKVGTRLVYKSAEDDSELEYYIKSVSHTFINFGSWVTTLGVIRGCPADKRFLSPWGEYVDYNGIGWAEYDPTRAVESASTLYDPTTGDFTSVAGGVIAGARSYIGKVVYVFGGTNIPGGQGDCSSFTQYVYKNFTGSGGIDIGRTTGDQITKGQPVQYDQLAPGDLVFFSNTYPNNYIGGVSHVGIFIGNDQMVHLDNDGCHISNIIGNSYWKSHWYGGRRVLASTTRTGIGKEVTGFIATAYGGAVMNGGAGTWLTSTGVIPQEGRTVAVDPKVIPIGNMVEITCDSFPSINGTYKAEDIGGAIKQKRIDIYFDDSTDVYGAQKRMLEFGRRAIRVKVLGIPEVE